jgi:hypothetical protein
MILFLAALFLLLVYLLPLYCLWLKRDLTGEGQDLFQPALFICGLGILSIPYMFLIAQDLSFRSPELRLSRWVNDLEATALGYVLLNAVMVSLMLIGAYSRTARAVGGWLPLVAVRTSRASVTRAAVFAAAVGGAMYLYFIHQIGGLGFLWAHMYLRTALGAGMGYLTMAYSILLTLSGALFVYRLRFNNGRAARLGTFVVVGLLCVILVSTGGRSSLLNVLILVILTLHYAVRRRKRLFTPGMLVLGTALFLVAVIVPMFRNSGTYDKYTGNPNLLARDAMRNLAPIASQFSGFDRTAVMLNYFTPERMWLGRGYLDLLYAPIPRSIFPRKPPVDDGVYFKEIADGRRVTPSRPAFEMRPTSWPMGTLATYMNFGPAGLIAAMLLSGVVVGATYRWMERCGYTPFAIFMYVSTAMGGPQLSVYGIVFFVINTAIAFLFFWIFFGSRTWPRPTLGMPTP